MARRFHLARDPGQRLRVSGLMQGMPFWTRPAVHNALGGSVRYPWRVFAVMRKLKNGVAL